MSTDPLEDVPIFINSRDRLTCLRDLLSWLSAAGHKNITILDNGSTYGPLLSFLNGCEYNVVFLNCNLGHTALWKVSSLASTINSKFFVWTDPDVIPELCTPPDAVSFFRRLLNKYPVYMKVGFGLRFDNLPDHYHLRREVIRWEHGLYSREVEPDVFEAPIDTTFALYRPGTPYCLGPALRTTGRYCARHTPWYLDHRFLDEEEIFYRKHALTEITHWNVAGKPADLDLDPAPLPPEALARPRFG